MAHAAGHRRRSAMLGWVLVASLVAVATVGAPSADASASGKKSTCPASATKIKLKMFSTGANPMALAVGPHGTIWFTQDNDTIGRLSPRGKLKTFSDGITSPTFGPSTQAALRGITKGPDGNLWFTEQYADRIGRITPDGTITEFSAGITRASIPEIDLNGAGPLMITTGPDGNLWFTESYAERIGRITPDGVVTEFGAGITPSPNQAIFRNTQGGYQWAEPRGITAGPDGNVWFTESSASRVGRITPDGAITEFPVPLDPPTVQYESGGPDFARIANLEAITVGPDGNLWFTERNGGPLIPSLGFTGAGAIGRITPTGKATSFVDGITAQQVDFGEGPQDDSADVRGLAVGPDGNLWFMERGGVGRITRTGEITEFPLDLDPLAAPDGIIAGPHGTLWFAAQAGRAIGRLTIRCAKAS